MFYEEVENEGSSFTVERKIKEHSQVGKAMVLRQGWGDGWRSISK